MKTTRSSLFVYFILVDFSPAKRIFLGILSHRRERFYRTLWNAGSDAAPAGGEGRPHRTRGALGNRPCPLRGAAFSGWAGAGEGRGNLPGWRAKARAEYPEEPVPG